MRRQYAPRGFRITRDCAVCGATYHRRPSQDGPYCSNPCRKQGRRGKAGTFEWIDNGTAARFPIFGRGDVVRGYTVVDACDVELTASWHWSLSAGYAVRRVTVSPTNRFTQGLHRELLGLTPTDKVEVDHIDRDRLNNRRANLRVVTKAGNRQNRPSRAGSTSQHRGVCFEAWSGKWKAQVTVNGVSVLSARFATEEDAAEAARAARAVHMPYATD